MRGHEHVQQTEAGSGRVTNGFAGSDSSCMETNAAGQSGEFPGFPELRANVTFAPLQLFTAVIPHRNRCCLRLVGYVIRHLLGWVDEAGNPRAEQLQFSYAEIARRAGLSRDSVSEAIREALEHRLIVCLQEARPDRTGQSRQSGVYALRWSNDYQDDPGAFSGFFRREAVVRPDQTQTPVAVAARKNIPNAYFDYVLRRERLSVIRVVGTLLFRSIQWRNGVERRVPVSMSVTELSRLTNLPRRHVHEALGDAMERGYLERIQQGRFGPGRGNMAATYRIRWTSSPVNPVYHEEPERKESPYPFSDRSKMGYGEPAEKGEQRRAERGHGHLAEKGNGISIKTSIKKQTAAAEPAESANKPDAVAAGGVMEKLISAGFDAPTALRLAKTRPPEVILRQIEWLPLRRASSNQLGLLRRAIEGDWARPEGNAARDRIPPEHALGAIFTRHFEAAFRSRTEVPETCSPKEARLASEYLHALDSNADELKAAEWGRHFGTFARGKKPDKPWLTWLLRVHGDEFIRQVRRASSGRERVAEAQAQRRREHEQSYLDYLREQEQRWQREQPELYRQFLAEHAIEQEDLVARFHLSEKSRAILAGESGRLTAFAAFAQRVNCPVLDSQQWRLESTSHDLKSTAPGRDTKKPFPSPAITPPAK